MTPKEKARQLVTKFGGWSKWTQNEMTNLFSAKQCALIAVDEILNSNNKLLSLDSVGVVFWLEVKKEITNL